MANFQNNAITENGTRLRSHVDMGAAFTATKIVIGSGNMPTGKTARTMTDVVSPVKVLPINKKERFPDGKVVFGGVYTNEDVAEEFYFRELALYAKAVYPDGTEVDEVLYSYGNAGGNAERMAAYSTSTVVERQMDIVTFIGNEAQVNLTIEPGIAVTAEVLKRATTLEALGAAPVGLVLGYHTVSTDAELDEVLLNTHNAMKDQTVGFIVIRVSSNDVSIGGGVWHFQLNKNSASGLTIEGIRYGSSRHMKVCRNYYSGELFPWEYENASMEPNIEYRTTERINGKTVYKRYVNGIIQYRLDNETTWKNYAQVVGASPAGFGYGEWLTQISATSADQDIQEFCQGFDAVIDRMGVASTCQVGVSVPWAFGSGYYLATIYKYSAKYSVVVASSAPIQGSAYGWRIAKEDATWGELEWLNAPMRLNVEYRTAERIDGKVVYKKNVNGVIQYRLDGDATWKNYSEAVGAVSTTKAGNQTIPGSLSARSFLVSDGYMNGDYGVDGALKRVELRAVDPNTKDMGALLVSPSGLAFMNAGGYEFRVFHEGNAPAVIATAELE